VEIDKGQIGTVHIHGFFVHQLMIHLLIVLSVV
jgi:hypothetical protein